MNNGYYSEGKHNYMCRSDEFAHYVFDSLGDMYNAEYSSAIELGAGMGRFSLPIINKFSNVILVEPSIDYAKSLSQSFMQPNVSIVNGDATSVLESIRTPEKFLVFSFHLMHHLNESQRIDIFNFVKRTRSFGILCEPNPLNPLIFLQILLNPHMKFEEERQYLKLSIRRYQKELDSCGLTIFQSKRICVLPPFVTSFLLRNRKESILKSAEKYLSKLPFVPSYLAVSYNERG